MQFAAMSTALLNRRLRGHYNYHGVRGNSAALYRFFAWAIRSAFKWLNRCGGKPMAVHPRRRDERGQTVDELERGEGERDAPVGRGLREMVEETLGVIGVALQALEREWAARAAPEQALQARPVRGLDPHAGIDREATAVAPATHALGRADR
jgi:hypothetical protein